MNPSYSASKALLGATNPKQFFFAVSHLKTCILDNVDLKIDKRIISVLMRPTFSPSVSPSSIADYIDLSSHLRIPGTRSIVREELPNYLRHCSSYTGIIALSRSIQKANVASIRVWGALVDVFLANLQSFSYQDQIDFTVIVSSSKFASPVRTLSTVLKSLLRTPENISSDDSLRILKCMSMWPRGVARQVDYKASQFITKLASNCDCSTESFLDSFDLLASIPAAGSKMSNSDLEPLAKKASSLVRSRERAYKFLSSLHRLKVPFDSDLASPAVKLLLEGLNGHDNLDLDEYDFDELSTLCLALVKVERSPRVDSFARLIQTICLKKLSSISIVAFMNTINSAWGSRTGDRLFWASATERWKSVATSGIMDGRQLARCLEIFTKVGIVDEKILVICDTTLLECLTQLDLKAVTSVLWSLAATSRLDLSPLSEPLLHILHAFRDIAPSTELLQLKCFQRFDSMSIKSHGSVIQASSESLPSSHLAFLKSHLGTNYSFTEDHWCGLPTMSFPSQNTHVVIPSSRHAMIDLGTVSYDVSLACQIINWSGGHSLYLSQRGGELALHSL